MKKGTKRCISPLILLIIACGLAIGVLWFTYNIMILLVTWFLRFIFLAI